MEVFDLQPSLYPSPLPLTTATMPLPTDPCLYLYPPRQAKNLDGIDSYAASLSNATCGILTYLTIIHLFCIWRMNEHTDFYVYYSRKWYYDTYMKRETTTVSTVIRIPAELHEKLRWLAFQERRSQHSIIMEIMEKALRSVQVPEEDKK